MDAKMDSYLLSQHFFQCKSDLNVYMLRNCDSLLIIVGYVDDLFITISSASIIADMKSSMHESFSMIYMGLLKFFLDLKSARKT